SLLVVRKLCMNARDLGDDKRTCGSDGGRASGVPVAQQDAGLEGADRKLPAPARSRAVGQLGVEVGVQIAVAGPSQRRATTLPAADSHHADPEQRLAVE